MQIQDPRLDREVPSGRGGGGVDRGVRCTDTYSVYVLSTVIHVCAYVHACVCTSPTRTPSIQYILSVNHAEG